MIVRPLFVFSWLTVAHAALLRPQRGSILQRPLGEAEEASCNRHTEVFSAEASLPTVDLGYVKHKAVFNLNPDLYHFNNIRYAAPPTGSRRFKAPQPPLESDQVEDGSTGKECLQATIKWAENFPKDVITNPDCCEKVKDDGTCEKECSGDQKGKLPQFDWENFLGGLMPKWNLKDPKRYSEDCLNLDVWVPKRTYDAKDGEDFYPVPVLVWIYGGAYIFGGNSLYPPGGLINRYKELLDDDIIFVSMNYRMGALGFAAGKDIADEDLNAGLLDQQQALKWVKDNIRKFGGDPDSVTAIGLSAGGGSVIHHLTANGGEGEPLFRRAISLSGGWQPVVNKTRAENTFQTFMKEYNNVKTIEELRKVSPEQMMEANYNHIYKSPPGTFTYNPVAWGKFAPKSPSKLLQEGKFHSRVDVLLSHAADEGTKFATAFKDKGTTVEQFLDLALPDLDKDEREFVVENYSDQKTPAENIGNIIGDATFRCHVTYVTDAKFGYVFRQRWNTLLSGGHGGDLVSLFYKPGFPVVSIRAALALQDYVLSFATFGSPQTIVNNADKCANPVPYRIYAVDRKEQYFDSCSPLPYPLITRGNDNLDPLCGIWQQFGST